MKWKDIKEIKDEIKAGMLLLNEDGSIHLVGDINELWGRCDCCTADGYTHYSDELLNTINLLKTS